MASSGNQSRYAATVRANVISLMWYWLENYVAESLDEWLGLTERQVVVFITRARLPENYAPPARIVCSNRQRPEAACRKR